MKEEQGEVEGKRRQCFYVPHRACSGGEPTLTLGTPHPPWCPEGLEAATVLVRLPAHHPTGGQSASGHLCQVATGTAHSTDGLRVGYLEESHFWRACGS